MKRNRSHKKIGALLAGLLVLLVAMSAAYAADSSVDYYGHTAVTRFGFAPDDLFDNFKNMMPGDTRDQGITVRNNSGSQVGVFLRGDPLKEESTANFLSRITFSVKNSQGDTLASDIKADTAWPADDPDQYFDLGRIEAGQTEDLTVTVHVPDDLENAFQNAIGKVQWVFMVHEYEEIVVPSPTPPYGEPSPPVSPIVTPTPKPSGGGVDIIVDEEEVPLGPGTPKTGDDAMPWVWAGALVVLSGTLVLLLAKRRKSGTQK